MEPQTPVSATVPAPAGAEPSLSVWQRAVAVFVRPTAAWGGLTARAQWWFPLLILLVVAACLSFALHQRAIVPMLQENWDQAVADGKMTAEQVDRMSAFMGGRAGLAIMVVQQVVALPIMMLISALAVWFAVGFVLGTRFRFRLAFEVVCWASLIMLPGQILTGLIAWSRESMKGIHIGLGILLPESDPPTKLQTGLGMFLDSVGPLALWYLAVLILGAAALSGAPRKRVAWAVGGLYLVLMVCIAALMGFMARGG